MAIRRSMAAVLAVIVSVGGAVGGCRSQESTTAQTGKEGTKVDFGVTDEPCPQAIDTSRGCIYLGTISDLTEGPFKALAVPITDAQKAFWRRVNEQGGIGGYEIDVTTYVKDNKYNPQIHNQVYQEIKPKILALAQTLGSPTTAAIRPDLKANNIVAAPASWTSLWAFEDVVVESGAELLHRIDERRGLRGRQAGRQGHHGRPPGRRLR
jgi:Periplasmic binding protein